MNLRNLVVLAGGILFGAGLAVGGMTKQEVVLSFLQLEDLGLLLLLGSSAIVTAIAVNLIPRLLRTPVLGGTFSKRRQALTKRTVIGAAIFGAGWGISGQCPGSALASIGIGNVPVLIGIFSMFIGAYLMGRFFGTVSR